MSLHLFADVGPPPGFVFGAMICLVVAAILLVVSVALFGLWLVRRKRKRENERREYE